ncbi:MAG: formate dehydrogenase accessory sulfurtransferase FdhD [bacterium]|nr:formate dehydrogenase accessory sulfurtransferase FdhD [bacterium]
MGEDSDRSPLGASIRCEITALTQGATSKREDVVAVEEPLEIRIVAEFEGARRSQSLSITMRSPGHDFELAAGFLLAEGIVGGSSDIWRIAHCEDSPEAGEQNIVEVHLKPGVVVDPERFKRYVYTNSSCGVCGKESIEALRRLGGKPPAGDLLVERRTIESLPETLRSAQDVFSRTGGMHACGVFSARGELEFLREDVGRHNAVDKAVGRLLLADALPASSSVFLVSGRASFELVHKAMAAGAPVLLAIGAPSSLAVETARAFQMTLAGFVQRDRFNVYCGRQRIVGL